MRAGAASWVYGRHAVAAALANAARRWYRLAVLAGQEQEAQALLAGAAAPRRGDGAPICVLDRSGFAALLSEDAVHQGLALAVEPLAEPDLEDVLRRATGISGRSALSRRALPPRMVRNTAEMSRPSNGRCPVRHS